MLGAGGQHRGVVYRANTYLLTYSLTYLPTYVHTYLYLLTSERYMKSV